MLRAAQAVDQPAHFVQRPRAAEVIPVAGERRAAGGARLLLHDQRALDAGLQPVEFVLFDALGQAQQLAEGHVERLLGPLGAGAGVAEHAAAVAAACGSVA